MRAMKALLVDDERLARNEFRRLLAGARRTSSRRGGMTTPPAEEAFGALKPRAHFSRCADARPDGFSCWNVSAPPLVIFTTAYDEFAVKAFEFSALDYLLKPIHPARLARALEHVQKRDELNVACAGELEVSADRHAR